MHLLVTGAAGFIGANFVRYWLRAPSGRHGRRAGRAHLRRQPANLAGADGPFVHADIGDLPRWRRCCASTVDVVVNFAAESHNSLAVHRPARVLRHQRAGHAAAARSGRRVGVARFHHVSTCEVYGDLALDDPGAFTEESPYRPRTPYNASKAGADHAVRAYHETYGLPVTITNCANNYGPYQFPEKVIPLFTTRALRGLPLPVYASSANRREWLHVDDHCAAIERVLHDGRVGATYHVGSGVEVSVADLATAILDRAGPARLA